VFLLPAFPALMLLTFALTLFTSATLLFMLQPLIGKMILPLLGGTPEVWNTCMVFFQALLLAGYGYAHATTTWLGSRKQALVHLAVLGLPFLFLPIAVDKELVWAGTAGPIPTVLLLLFFSVGVPFFVVSASAPMLQKWFAATDHPAARDPYFLYGASNLGSMLVLLAYPTLIEPHLPLTGQRFWWAVVFGVLVVLTAGCSVCLWLANPPRQGTPQGKEPQTLDSSGAVSPSPEVSEPVLSGKAARKRKARNRSSQAQEIPDSLAFPAPGTSTDTALTGTVTAWRRLRWVLLALVPSSMMLGATTYLTTDIAAIPMLLLPPLALYLLSFIIVFANVPRLVHVAMILAMPLLLLLLVFMILSELKPDNVLWVILIHLASLFVVAMVCHGELAHDRPPTRYLTEYYLWLSVGGVAGGLFNALIAPLVFNSLLEYKLMVVVAALLLPPLLDGRTTRVGVAIDTSLTVGFLLIAVFLLGVRLTEGPPEFGPGSRPEAWTWQAAGLLLGLGGGLYLWWRDPQHRLQRGFDLVLPLTLGLLVIALSFAMHSKPIWARVEDFAKSISMEPEKLALVLEYGVPAVLCYTFIERTTRFGLGVGAILLASAFCTQYASTTVFQKRTFFGVLTIEDRFDTVWLARASEALPRERIAYTDQWSGWVKYLLPVRRLVHGTTMHGKQFKDEPLKHLPLTYYHRSGPVGRVMAAYNRDADALGLVTGPYAALAAWPGHSHNIGVIGLGTGTLAAYARPGQSITFYEIDPLVLAIARNPVYFSYLADAEKRGSKIQTVVNDARLAIERQLAEQPDWPEEDKYGILVVDAFSSDAIPIHLITREALQLYLRVLREDGIVAFHISNRYLDLEPVLGNLARAENLACYSEKDNSQDDPGKARSHWVVLARKEGNLEKLLLDSRGSKSPGPSAGSSSPPSEHWLRTPVDDRVGIWTDDYSNLWSVFWWGK
jgi:SAM-dependent methyltransferase